MKYLVYVVNNTFWVWKKNIRFLVTVQNPLSREVFWHEYAKIPRHARQNSITKGDFIEFWLRICEGTEQIRRKYKWFRKVVDERAEPL